MTKYMCFLESNRDFVINADDDMDAAYIANAYAAWMYDDYLLDLEPIYDVYTQTLPPQQLARIQGRS